METTNQMPQTTKEAQSDWIKRLAAKRCREEYRAAYCHLLEELWQTTDFLRDEYDYDTKEQVEAQFRYHILLLVMNEPQIDPYELGDIAEDLAPVFPGLNGFAERVKILADLQ